MVLKNINSTSCLFPYGFSSPHSVHEAFEALDLLDGETAEESEDQTDFENITYPPPSKITLSPTEEAKTFFMVNHVGLSLQDVESFVDKDGRIIEEHKFREAVFKSKYNFNQIAKVKCYLLYMV